MAALTDEILRYGIERTATLDLNHRHKSVIFEGDVLDQLIQNNLLSRSGKQFRPLRERADTNFKLRPAAFNSAGPVQKKITGLAAQVP